MMNDGEYTATFVQALRENADRLGLMWKRRPATVIAPESDDPTGVAVIMDGDTVGVNAYSLIGVPPVGSRIMCDIVPPSGIYIIGHLGHVGAVPGAILAGSKRFTADGAATVIAGVELLVGSYTITIMEPLNAVIRLECGYKIGTTVANESIILKLRRDGLSGTQVGEDVRTVQSTSFGYTFRTATTVLGTGLSTTYVLTAQRLSGGGTFNVVPSNHFIATTLGDKAGVLSIP